MDHLLKAGAFLFLLLPFSPVLANDGAFRANGNQLIPMYETAISVKKEVLTIRRINKNQAQILVYYEFFNPKEEKEIEVGFEASSPTGDANHTPDANGHQPYISRFTVELNGASLPFKVTIVQDSLYYRNGKFKAVPLATAIKQSQDEEYVDFMYVYHFKAVFKPGVNIIRHSYTLDLSSAISESYSLYYVLTAAKRWANRQIDDFTLQIDMGEFQDLCIENSFFKKLSDWTLPDGGKGIQTVSDPESPSNSPVTEFFIRKGPLVFQQKDFKPAGELNLQSRSSYYNFNANHQGPHPDNFDSKHDNLPFSIEVEDDIHAPLDELSGRIIKNLPFARRGYVFKSPELKAYYEKQKWYLPDPGYTPVLDQLTKKEQEWLKKQ